MKNRYLKWFFVCLILLTNDSFATYLSDNTLGTLLKEELIGHFRRGSKIEVSNTSIRMKVPVGGTIRIVGPNPPLGVVQFEYFWKENETVLRQDGLTVIRVFDKVAVSTGVIKPNEPLTSSNVSFEEKELNVHIQSGYFSNWGQLDSMVAKGLIAPRTILNLTNTHIPPAVASGQILDLVKENPSYRMVAKVKALEPGRVNSIIRVENINTRKVVQARVRSDGRVDVP